MEHFQISHIYQVRNPKKTFGNGRPLKKEGDWANPLCITLKVDQSDFSLLPVQPFAAAVGFLSVRGVILDV